MCIRDRVTYARKTFQDTLRSQVPEVQMDESTSSDTTALVDLRLYGARGDVPRSELHGLRGVFLHEALTGLIEEIPALAARTLRHEDVRSKQAGRMELNELHILERGAGVVGQSHPAPRGDYGHNLHGGRDGSGLPRRRPAQGYGVHSVPSDRLVYYEHPHDGGCARRGRVSPQ